MYFYYFFVLLLTIQNVYLLPHAGLRVIGGEFAGHGRFPFHVSITVNDKFRCGGSLISKLFVLTAAHCLYDKSISFDAYDLKVIIGHTLIVDGRPGTNVADVDKVYVPKEFLSTDHWYINGDIAVLRLSETASLPINWLPTLPQNKSYAGKPGVSSGHGLNLKVILNPDDSKSPVIGVRDDILRFTDVIILSNEDCKTSWNDRDVPENLVCAKTDVDSRTSLCDGDSGGPLVHGEEIVGVLSFGSPKCQPGFPEVFTRVSSYAEFIHKAVNDQEDPDILTYDLKYYTYTVDQSTSD